MAKPRSVSKYARLRDIVWAEAIAKPEGLPAPKARGRKAEGLRYEKKVALALGPGVKHGAWFRYLDRIDGQIHVCQTDFLLGYGGKIWIGEAKYSLVEEGFDQLELLYEPVVRLALGREVEGFQICKVLRPHGDWRVRPTIFSSLENLFASAAKRRAWHWLGDNVAGTHIPASGPRGLDSGLRPSHAGAMHEVGAGARRM